MLRVPRPLLLTLFLLLLAASAGFAAPAPPPDTLRPLSPDRLLRYTYANDLWFRTDYYFTQGMSLTLVHPWLARLPGRRLLPAGAAGSTQHHGLSLHYDGFTPLRIQDAFIRVGDRPYASYLYATFFRVSTLAARRGRLTSALEVGFMGPGAGGKGFQTAIHRRTGSPIPRGWDFQMRTAPVLGYRLGYEKLLLAAPRHAELLGSAAASLGTLYTYAGAGAQLRAGWLNPYFANLGGVSGPAGRAGRRRWQLYTELGLEGRLIGYDATLQGGVFRNDNPYELPARDVRRLVLRPSGSVVLAYQGLSLALRAAQVSPEFRAGRRHRWNQLVISGAF